MYRNSFADSLIRRNDKRPYLAGFNKTHVVFCHHDKIYKVRNIRWYRHKKDGRFGGMATYEWFPLTDIWAD